MYISALNFATMFGSKVVYELSKEPLTSYEKNYIDRFEEGDVWDTKFLGEGVTSKAYYSSLNDFVIKQNKPNPYIAEKQRSDMGSLAYENDILLKIDPSVKTTQRGKAYVETAKGGKFLISSFVNGKPADRWSNPFREKHIDRLLRNLYRLDKSMIIHSDLSRPNLLLDSQDNVNFIDYQWADTYSFNPVFNNYSLRNAFFADFESPNNASMFEGAGLAGYVRPMDISEAKDFLTKYYAAKTPYIEKNIHRLKKLKPIFWGGNFRDRIEFETSKAKAYGNIDSYIVNAEVLKMNILNLHRRQFSCHDTNKIEPRNILRAIPLMIKAKECADALAEYSDGYNTDATYYSYMRKLGQYWQSNIEKWYPVSLKWIFNLVSGKITDPARVFFPEKFNDFKNIDIVEASYNSSYIRKFESQDLKLRELFKDAHFWGYSSRYCPKDEAFKIIKNLFVK